MTVTTAQSLRIAVQDVRLAFSKTGCVTSAVLVMAGTGLDLAVYPDQAPTFLLVRSLVAVATLLLLWVIQGEFGRRHVRVLTLLWLALPQIMIAWMIAQTEGAASIYFVGLHLALYAVGMIVPISYLEGLGFGVFTCLIYVAACFWHAGGVVATGQFVAHLLFTAFSAIICVGCTYFAELSRLRLFALREQVAEQNARLQESNRALAEVKGQLIQREKMAAIGTLSAGLLHELNNPVNYSLMAIDMGLTCPGVEGDAMLKESLGDAREGMQRIQNIVSDLKTFAYQKPGQDAQRPFLLGNALRSALRLAGYELKGIDVPVELPQDTHVLGDEPAIIGVLINLLSNAAHALQAAKREQPRIAVTVVPRGQRLFVSVRDNGTGIAPENLGRVFEPFFTTRDVGAGLGLGLSVSYGIVQRHGGTLAVESELGAWTEFTFDLPRPA
ncbi:sensor histidine kinase [Hydrogenophaga sp.]|uniref:sensor histidine kinase n=1 Tax=Hydrogenophaga sp. TaxID=1904254 RepID=UPI00272FCD80|nr:ATP-binding protein [Hydrogenophaga sp.]MDP2074324.1 ATP-binding protein [Hydrogenophaga sp.]MDP3109906.1 ATP-binding protein [Hydrogenophaga sp.]MDP3349542.1 ATP-binding protein [Hydrogenophaga sp.]MDZ4400727.1 ATP-binding protein [Hydrogenophaga sp.]